MNLVSERLAPWGDSVCLPKPLGDNTAVPFKRAGVVLYSHPFSSLVRTLKTHTKKIGMITKSYVLP